MKRKSQVPRGATRKELCKCKKFYYWNYKDAGSSRSQGSCSYCKIAQEMKK